MKRVRTAVGALGLALLWAASASADYRGTDVFDNIGPGPAFNGMADRYPLSAYALDYYVAGPSVGLGGASTGNIPELITQSIASNIWNLTVFMERLVIDMFAWAFSLDLLGGAHGALGPVSAAVRGIYETLGGPTWLVAAFVITGLWGIWKGLVQQRYAETIGGLGVSVLIMVVALFCIYQPQTTIGQASRWTNDLSGAFLAAGSGNSPDNPTDAKRAVVTHLRQSIIQRPWAAVEFGGLRHCVNGNDRDADGFPRPVGLHDPRRTTCRDHLRRVDGFGGYAPRFLRYAPGSKQRKAEYEALRDGKAPEVNKDEPLGAVMVGVDPHQFDGYQVDKADAPAADLMQAGGAYQRFGLVLLIFVGALGIVSLLLMMALVVILAQVAALALLAFAPVALVLGVIPGRGHAIFKWWGSQLLTALFIKVLYSLVLGVLVFISAALIVAAGALGFLFAFVLQAAFFWGVLIYRKRITQALLASTVGRYDEHHVNHRKVTRRASNAAQRPVSALVGMSAASTGAAAGAAAGAVKGRVQKPVSETADLREAEHQAPTAEEVEQSARPTADLRAVEYQPSTPEEQEEAEYKKRWDPQESGLVEGALDTPTPQRGVNGNGARDDLAAVGYDPAVSREEKMQQLGDLLQRQMDPEPDESVIQPGLDPGIQPLTPPDRS